MDKVKGKKVNINFNLQTETSDADNNYNESTKIKVLPLISGVSQSIKGFDDDTNESEAVRYGTAEYGRDGLGQSAELI